MPKSKNGANGLGVLLKLPWLIANQYYLVKEVDEKEHRLSFNLGGEKGGWHW